MVSANFVAHCNSWILQERPLAPNEASATPCFKKLSVALISVDLAQYEIFSAKVCSSWYRWTGWYMCNIAIIVLSHRRPGPEVIKLFSFSTQVSMKFQMLISIKIS